MAEIRSHTAIPRPQARRLTSMFDSDSLGQNARETSVLDCRRKSGIPRARSNRFSILDLTRRRSTVVDVNADDAIATRDGSSCNSNVQNVVENNSESNAAVAHWIDCDDTIVEDAEHSRRTIKTRRLSKGKKTVAFNITRLQFSNGKERRQSTIKPKPNKDDGVRQNEGQQQRQSKALQAKSVPCRVAQDKCLKEKQITSSRATIGGKRILDVKSSSGKNEPDQELSVGVDATTKKSTISAQELFYVLENATKKNLDIVEDLTKIVVECKNL